MNLWILAFLIAATVFVGLAIGHAVGLWLLAREAKDAREKDIERLTARGVKRAQMEAQAALAAMDDAARVRREEW